MKSFANGVGFIKSKYVRSSTEYVGDCGSVLEAFSPVILMGQMFGVLPVCGIFSRNSHAIRFKWKCFRTIYTSVVIFSLTVFLGFTVYWMMNKKIEFGKFVMLIFYTCNWVLLIYFLRLSMKWPEIMRRWCSAAHDLPQMKTSKELPNRIKCISTTLMSLSLIEYILSIWSGWMSVTKCEGIEAKVSGYYEVSLAQLAFLMDYNIAIFTFGTIVNTIATFVWTFANLFVIIISTTLATHFKQINDYLQVYKGKIVPEMVWKHQRTNYRNLKNLTEIVDQALGKIILISVGNNLFFICVQLLNSLNTMSTFANAAYFWFSLLFVIARTLAVSLYSAEINDESKQLVDIFRAVPQASWCFEVKRFSEEVIFDNIALSAMKFFFLTRKLVLTVVDTIVTYEIVLMQFHQDNGVTDKKNPCA